MLGYLGSHLRGGRAIKWTSPIVIWNVEVAMRLAHGGGQGAERVDHITALDSKSLTL